MLINDGTTVGIANHGVLVAVSLRPNHIFILVVLRDLDLICFNPKALGYVFVYLQTIIPIHIHVVSFGYSVLVFSLKASHFGPRFLITIILLILVDIGLFIVIENLVLIVGRVVPIDLSLIISLRVFAISFLTTRILK